MESKHEGGPTGEDQVGVIWTEGSVDEGPERQWVCVGVAYSLETNQTVTQWEEYP